MHDIHTKDPIVVSDPTQEILHDLPVKHSRENPVFILGHARSGTSILVKMVRKYLKVNFGTESQFIIRYYRRLSQYGDLNDDKNLRSLINDISRERCFKRWKKRFGFDLDPEQVFDNVRERTYRGVLDSFFGQFCDYHQMVRWGDKTPEYSLHLGEMMELFPDAQFIHIVRDGRDVALSNFRTQFGAKNTFTAATEWVDKVGKIQAFVRTLPAERFIEIRYEDLMQFPEDTMNSLKNFLQIDDDGRLREFIASNIHRDLKSSNILKWKSAMSRRQIKMYERVASGYLKDYNYETRFMNTNAVTAPEKLFWAVHNKVNKVLNVRYWHDNVYKFRLRLGTTMRQWQRKLRLAASTIFPA